MSNQRTLILPAELAAQLLALVDEVHEDLDTRSSVPSSLTLGQSFKRLRMCEEVHEQLWDLDGQPTNGSQRVEPGTPPHPSEVG
jgi:hypothetical protein